MKEASLVKYYFAKYFFLAFGALQLICAALLFLKNSLPAALLFFAIGTIALMFYTVIGPRLKRVSFGKNRIVVISGDETVHYEWPQVKWIRPIPYVSAYILKFRGKKGRIYFLPREQDVPLFGLSSPEPELADLLRRKMK